MFYKIIINTLVIFFICGVASANSNETQQFDKLYWGLHFGVSPYTGALGLELQKQHFAATIGFPCIGLKYYPNEMGQRWFYGAHVMFFTVKMERTC